LAELTPNHVKILLLEITNKGIPLFPAEYILGHKALKYDVY